MIYVRSLKKNQGKICNSFSINGFTEPAILRLEIEYSLEEKVNTNLDSKHVALKIKIAQVQEANDLPFVFPLELRIITDNDDNDKKPETIQISQKITEYSFDLLKDTQIKWISIDPEFKVLSEIKSLKIADETENFRLGDMLMNQLKSAKTLIERIQAARLLKGKRYSNDNNVIHVLQELILKDSFYGLRVEVANTLGSYSDKSDYVKSNSSYHALKKCLDEGSFNRLPPQVRQSVSSRYRRL